MSNWRSIADIRREYGDLQLDEAIVPADPFTLFTQWFQEVLALETSDPTAMTLSTVDEQGHPDARIVLLKGLEEETFIFYTNYDSNKALQLAHHSYAALTFYWPQMARQVRVRGQVRKVSADQSDNYFSSRPVVSQVGALASPQSRVIADRAELENTFNQLLAQFAQQPIMRPNSWGGYGVKVDTIEFWQGRDNRLHDRLRYFRENNTWQIQRLAP